MKRKWWYNNIIVCVKVKVFLNFGDIYPCQWVVWCCVVSPRGYNRTYPNQTGKTREPPTDPNGTKAATINNHLIILTLYSSGKQRKKKKSRDYFPACYYLKNLPLFDWSLTSSKHNAIGKIKMHIIKAMIFSIKSFFFSGVIYSTPLTVTRS